MVEGSQLLKYLMMFFQRASDSQSPGHRKLTSSAMIFTTSDALLLVSLSSGWGLSTFSDSPLNRRYSPAWGFRTLVPFPFSSSISLSTAFQLAVSAGKSGYQISPILPLRLVDQSWSPSTSA